MPTYDYRCDTNDRVIEVSHRMSENLTNWGELCACAGMELGDTPADAPVHRLATGGNVITSSSLGSGRAPMPACASGSCCAGGMCGLN
ncbi:MAG: zinc ribbon domain-containing protein [Chromatiales bacterium]|nr:zinc ribbon domain-containing protein [Chromatiales bacterium]